MLGLLRVLFGGGAARGRAVILSRGQYVVAGVDVAAAVFASVDPGLRCECKVKDGAAVKPDEVLMTIEAMKMETAVTARTAGKVREIRVKEGQAVKAKELLMLLD